MPAVFEYQHVVTEQEIDPQGHVNNLEYLRWMQEAAIKHSAAQGWPAERYLEFGAGWVVRSHSIEYLRPAFAGDHIAVTTWVSNFRKIQSLRKYKVVRFDDNSVLAVAATNWAFVGLEHRVPRRVPPELSSAFVIVAAEDEP